MNRKQVISATVMSVLQNFAFILSWNTAVLIANHLGRHQRGGVAFGVTVHYGAIVLAFVILSTSFLAVSRVRKNIKFGVISILSIIWLLFFVFPTLENYPLRGTTFGSLGISTIMIGCSILLIKNKKTANQNIEPIVTTPVESGSAQSTQAHV